MCQIDCNMANSANLSAKHCRLLRNKAQVGYTVNCDSEFRREKIAAANRSTRKSWRWLFRNPLASAQWARVNGERMALVSKIGIIGAGHVGAHVANALLFKGLATELYISDIDEVLCKAQVNDLLDAMPFYPHPARVFEVDARYEELADCDIIVNAAGHIEAAAASRDGELFVTTDEARKFAKRISDAGFNGVWVSISNPCDVVSTEIQYLTGCDPKKVIGSGTTLDSARFRHALSKATGYPASCINAWMLGEHGNGQFALWSHVTFGCLTDKEIEDRTGVKFDRAQLEQDARMGGYVTYKGISPSIPSLTVLLRLSALSSMTPSSSLPYLRCLTMYMARLDSTPHFLRLSAKTVSRRSSCLSFPRRKSRRGRSLASMLKETLTSLNG